MNVIIYSLFPIFILGATSGSCILVNHEEYSIIDHASQLHNITEHIIFNDSEDISYITFICQYSENCDIQQTIIRYFLSTDNDFSLLTLLTDNVTFQEYIPIVGKTFLKEIMPKTKFKYTCIDFQQTKKAENDGMGIFVVEKKYLENLLNTKIINDILFQNEEIIIP